jgi:hypothetical protein
MIASATPIDAFVPILAYEFEGRSCLEFAYDPDILPGWRFPDAVEYRGIVHARTGHNSDTLRVYYRSGIPVARGRA